jgi:hypothetical protein
MCKEAKAGYQSNFVLPDVDEATKNKIDVKPNINWNKVIGFQFINNK